MRTALGDFVGDFVIRPGLGDLRTDRGVEDFLGEAGVAHFLAAGW